MRKLTSFFLISVLLFLFFLPSLSKAMDYSGWAYSVRISINNPNSNALSNYQTRIVLNDSVLPNFDWGSDEASIRFSDENNNPLPYWIEEYDATNKNLIVWVKTNLTSGSNNITMYYHNPSASDESDGDAVFEFFDDFNGTQLDTNKWIVKSGTHYSISNSALDINDVDTYLTSSQTFTPPFILEGSFKTIAVNQQLGMSVTSDGVGGGNRAFCLITGHEDYYLDMNGDGTYEVVKDWINNQPNDLYPLIQLEVLTDKTSVLFNSSQGVFGETDNYGTSNSLHVSLGSYSSGHSSTSGEEFLTYWVRIRKYAVTEPTITSVEAINTEGPSVIASVNNNVNSKKSLVQIQGLNLNESVKCFINITRTSNLGDSVKGLFSGGIFLSPTNNTFNFSLYLPIGDYDLFVNCENDSLIFNSSTSFEQDATFNIITGPNLLNQNNFNLLIKNSSWDNNLIYSSINISENNGGGVGVFDCDRIFKDYFINLSDVNVFSDTFENNKYPTGFLWGVPNTNNIPSFWYYNSSTNSYSSLPIGFFVCEPHPASQNNLFDASINGLPPTNILTLTGPNTFFGLKINASVDWWEPPSFNKTIQEQNLGLNPYFSHFNNNNLLVWNNTTQQWQVYYITRFVGKTPTLTLFLDNNLLKKLVLSEEGVGAWGSWFNKTITLPNYEVFSNHEFRMDYSLLPYFVTSTTHDFINHYGEYNISLLWEKNNSLINLSNSTGSVSYSLVCENNNTLTGVFNTSQLTGFVVDCMPQSFNVLFSQNSFVLNRAYDLLPGINAVNAYLINSVKDAFVNLKFVFEGLENYENPRIVFEKGGRIVFSARPDITYSISNYFLQNQYYSIVLYSNKGVRALGNVLADASGTKVIRISPFVLVSNPSVFKNIGLSYSLNNSIIRVVYDDSSNKTSSVLVTIKNDLGQVVFENKVVGENNIVFTYNIASGINSSYFVVSVDVVHDLFGNLHFEKVLSENGVGGFASVLTTSFLNYASVFVLILLLIILSVAGVSVSVSGIIVLVGVGLFNFLGWLSINPLFLGFLVGVVVIGIIGDVIHNNDVGGGVV